MWDIVDIVWPTFNDCLNKGMEEQVILDQSLELSFPVRCDMHMVDGDVLRYLLSLEGCIAREGICN